MNDDRMIVKLASSLSVVADVSELLSTLCEAFGVAEGEPGARLVVPPRYGVLSPGVRPGVLVLGDTGNDGAQDGFLPLNLGAGGPAGWVAPPGLDPLIEQAAVSLVGLAVSRILLRSRVQQDRDDVIALARIAELASSSLELDTVLDDTLERAERIVPFDAAGVFVLEEDGTILAQSTRGYDDIDPSVVNLKVGQGLVGHVVSSGRTVVVPDVSQDSRYFVARKQTRSELVCPLSVGGRVIGALNFESDSPAAFTRNHVELATSFSAYVAAVVERARLHEALVEQRRLENELTIARRIQSALLFDEAPSVPGYEIAGLCTPSTEVGGDYLGFIPIVEDQWGIAIADVSGKGVPAALVMATFRASLLAEIRNEYAIRTIMAKVNALLVESVEPYNFVTAAYGVLDARAKQFTYANAGHESPILLRSDGSVELLTEGGLPLGAFAGSSYYERSVELASGDQLLMLTDGVTDPGPEGGLSERELVSILNEGRDLTAGEILTRIDEAAADCVSVGDEGDDRTMLLVRVS
jgi:sigma-B regulation protein RsbU (phosphoserine phosphatase)